jgi:hypothetical protein
MPPDDAAKLNKTQFVLSLPRQLPGAQVVAQAAQAGIQISAKHVATIRSSARAKAGRTKPTSKRTSAPTPPKGAKRSGKKVARSSTKKAPKLGRATSPKSEDNAPTVMEIVTATKPARKTASKRLNKARSSDAESPAEQTAPPARTARRKIKTRTTSPKVPRAAGSASTPMLERAAEGNVEFQFRRMVVELGVRRANELVSEVRAKLADLFAGA